MPSWNSGLTLDTDRHHILPFYILRESLAKESIFEKKSEHHDRATQLSTHTEPTASTTGVSEGCVDGEELLQVVRGKIHMESGMMANGKGI